MKKRLFALFTLILFTLSLFLPSHEAFSKDNANGSYEKELTSKLKYDKKADALPGRDPQEFKVTVKLNLEKSSNETKFENFIFEDKINYDYFQIVKDTLEVQYPNGSSKEIISFNDNTNTVIGNFKKLQNNFQEIKITYNIRLKDGLIIKEDQEVPVSKDTKLTCDVKNEEKITIDLDCSLKIQIKDNTLKDLLTLTQKSEKKEYKLNEEFNLNYSITPREIKSSELSGLVSKPKDVVLMVDTSGSMAWDLYGEELGSVKTIDGFKNFLISNKYNDNDNEAKQVLEYITFLEENDIRFSQYKKVVNNFNLLINPNEYSWWHKQWYYTWDGWNYRWIRADDQIIKIVESIQTYYKTFNFDKSRLDIVKEALNKFLDSFKDKSYGEGVNIVLNTFSSYINEKDLTIKLGSDKIKNNKAIEDAKKWISALKPQGSTNIGAALEEGQRILKSYQNNENHEQYLVMLTDGVPEANKNFESASWYEDGTSTGKANNGILSEAKDYAITVANNIAKNSPNINNYLLGFSKDSPLEQLQSIACEYDEYNLSNIIKKITGNNRESILKSVNKEFAKYKKKNSELPNFNIKQALKAEDIKDVYAKIAEDINADLTLKNLKFEFQLPTGLEPVELPNGFQYSDGKIIGSLDNVKYTLKNGQYVAEKMDFNIKVKGINPGKMDLENKAKLIYKDIYDRNKEEFFKGLNSVEIKSYSSAISIISHGLFLENTGIGENKNVSIANKIKSNFGVKIESNVYEAFSMDIVVNSHGSNLSSQGQISVDKKDIAIYRIENGVLKGMSLKNIAGLEVKKIGEKTKITFINFKLQPGEYIVSYKVLPRLKDSSNNVSIANDAICTVDNNKKINQILDITIQPLPDLD